MRILLPTLLAMMTLVGCVKRTVSITSEPQGALVWVNDREVGRTPISFEFLYYGEYDVRVEMNGFEPIMTTRWARSPAWDWPVIDVVVEVMSSNLESRTDWHFDLSPSNDNPTSLLERANALRASTTGERDE